MSFFIAALSHQPPGGLLEEEKSDEHQTTGDELDGHRDTPLFRALRDMQGDPVVDPVSCRAKIKFTLVRVKNKVHAQEEDVIEVMSNPAILRWCVIPRWLGIMLYTHLPITKNS